MTEKLRSSLSEETFIHGPLFLEDPVKLGGVEVGPNVYIGMHSYMVSGMIRSQVEIGRYCAIGRHVTIGAGEHNISALSIGGPISLRAGNSGRKRASGRHDRRVIIGDDVWVGDKVTIVSGITVGTGAILGSNAVITKDVPPYTVVGGVPAKFIKKRFPDETAQRLMLTRWWEIAWEHLSTIDLSDIDVCLMYLEKNDLPRMFAARNYSRYERRPSGQGLRSQIAAMQKQIDELKASLRRLELVEKQNDVAE